MNDIIADVCSTVVASTLASYVVQARLPLHTATYSGVHDTVGVPARVGRVHKVSRERVQICGVSLRYDSIRTI